MIFIKTSILTNAVTFIHYSPLDEKDGMKNEDGTVMTEEQLKQIGYLVDAIPIPTRIEGKGSTTYYEPTKGFWFEYYDVEVDPYQMVPTEVVDKIQDDMTLALIEAGVL